MADLEAPEDLSHHSLVRYSESGSVFVPIQAPALIRENLNDYCCHVMQKVRRYTEYSMTWHLSRANMKFDENLVIFMQL